MKFWDREKEKAWLKHYLQTEPNAILFVYGPKSSGKTTLLMKVVEELPKDDFIYYWYDLREELISDYDSVIRLFFTPKGWLKEFISAVKPKINLGVFEIEPHVLEEIKRKERKPFTEMRKRLEEDRAKGKMPVIVFDELQKLKEVYLNGDSKQRPLVRELFNFFVRITKVLHLAHVIVMTSDTFFIERVYFDSTLENTSRYFLVDYFDDETARKILLSEGLSEAQAVEVVKMTGGIPWVLMEVLKEEDPVLVANELYKQTKSKLIELVRSNESYKNVLKKILEGENMYGETEEGLKELVDREVLFMDPVNGEVRFQTRMHERAAKQLLGLQ